MISVPSYNFFLQKIMTKNFRVDLITLLCLGGGGVGEGGVGEGGKGAGSGEWELGMEGDCVRNEKWEMTSKAHLSIRTSRTNHMSSWVVVNLCISLETLRVFLPTDLERDPKYELPTRTSCEWIHKSLSIHEFIQRSANSDTIHIQCVVLSRMGNTHSSVFI